MDSVSGGEIGVIEFRRYKIRATDREDFSRRFDAWFPEALQQLGAVVIGQFLERNDPAGFAWFRGYRDMDARLAANTAFYDGPVWAEHKDAVNEPMLAWDNVLLMRPLLP